MWPLLVGVALLSFVTPCTSQPAENTQQNQAATTATTPTETPAGDINGVARTCTMMATTIEFRVVAPPARTEAAGAAIDRAQAAMEDFVAAINTWDPKSNAAQVNAQAGRAPVRVDARLLKLLLHCRQVSEISGGAFDVTFMPLGRAWNVRAANFVLPSEQQVAAARALVNYKDFILDEPAGTAFLRRPGMEMELGAIAKGAAVDVGVRSLRESGFPDALVRASGDTFAAGSKGGQPWIVGIQHPRHPRNELLGKVALCGKAISTSGDYEKMKIVDGKRYHHIIDPRTGRPAALAIAATVIAGDTETADAFATSMLLLGPRDGLELCKKLPGVEALIVDPDLRITKTPGFPAFIE